MQDTESSLGTDAVHADTIGRSGNMSSPFQHVLVPLDGSQHAERALEFAGMAASGFGARTTLLQVLAPPSEGTPVNPLEWELKRAQARRYLDEVGSWLASDGLVTTRVVEQGRPPERIVDYAHEHGVDLIVLHSHGEGGPRPQLGDTSQRVVGSAGASVLVVAGDGSEPTPPRLRRILVSLDCSPRAECVLPVVSHLGLATQAEILLCHVVEEPELSGRLGDSPRDVALAGHLVRRNVQEATKYLERIRARLVSSGLRCDTRVLTANHAPAAIRELAEREAADLVVVCAHGRGGRCADPHGAVAAALAQQPTRPLLIVQDAQAARPGSGPSPRRAPLVRRGR